MPKSLYKRTVFLKGSIALCAHPFLRVGRNRHFRKSSDKLVQMTPEDFRQNLLTEAQMRVESLGDSHASAWNALLSDPRIGNSIARVWDTYEAGILRLRTRLVCDVVRGPAADDRAATVIAANAALLVRLIVIYGQTAA